MVTFEVSHITWHGFYALYSRIRVIEHPKLGSKRGRYIQDITGRREDTYFFSTDNNI